MVRAKEAEESFALVGKTTSPTMSSSVGHFSPGYHPTTSLLQGGSRVNNASHSTPTYNAASRTS